MLLQYYGVELSPPSASLAPSGVQQLYVERCRACTSGRCKGEPPRYCTSASCSSGAHPGEERATQYVKTQGVTCAPICVLAPTLYLSYCTCQAQKQEVGVVVPPASLHSLSQFAHPVPTTYSTVPPTWARYTTCEYEGLRFCEKREAYPAPGLTYTWADYCSLYRGTAHPLLALLAHPGERGRLPSTRTLCRSAPRYVGRKA